MKPIQKQTGEIKLNRENPQFGYFLSFARRESLNNEYYGLFAKDNGLHTIKLTRNQYQVHSNF